MRSQEREPHLVRAGVGEIHMDMSAEPFCAEIYRKNAARYFPGPHFVCKFTGKNAHGHCTRAILCEPQVNTSIEHRRLTVTVRTPQCGHTVWGK